MDHSYWNYGMKRLDVRYLSCFADFLKVVEENRVKKGEGYTCCLCIDFQNYHMYINSTKIEEHLITHGFMSNYTCWS